MAMEFEIKESQILKGVYIIKPNSFKDERGEICSIYEEKSIKNLLPSGLDFVLDKMTLNRPNVLRGIHGDHKSWKLATALTGEIHQVVVDCRKDSPTYLKWERFIINEENRLLVLIPPFCGNAVYVSSKTDSLYFYKWAYGGEYVDAAEQFTYAYNDPRIAIPWPSTNPMLSKRDLDAALNGGHNTDY